MEIYEYGLELISGDLINFAVVLLLSALLQNIGTGVLYLLCFVSVRLFSGGFHAKTHFRCGLAMAVFYLLFSVIYRSLVSSRCGSIVGRDCAGVYSGGGMYTGRLIATDL